MLFIDSISKSFNERPVLQDVSFQIGKAEIKILRGKNGSGKTTLLKIIASLMSYNSGTIFFEDKERNKGQDYLKKNIFYIGNSPGMYKFLTPLQNIELGLSLRQKEIDSNIILNTLERFGLSDSIYQPINTFSSGMLQRLKFAYAFIANWKIILLDEPFNGLDESGLILVKNCIDTWLERKKSILMVTHKSEIINSNSKNILLLDNGKVKAL